MYIPYISSIGSSNNRLMTNESKIIKYYTLTLIITMNIRYMLCVILCIQLFKK